LLAIVFGLGLCVLSLLALKQFGIPASMTVIVVAIICGLLLAMLVYTKLSRWVIARFNLEDQLDPLFQPRSGKKNKTD
jgi:uncharacterized protein (DUF2062 family)